ncbi:glyoxalase [marine bacterium AO1-C]|nr:glyoxalase [marine bacterium AO1-C]
MKRIFFIVLSGLWMINAVAQNKPAHPQTIHKMKLNAGIITKKLKETKDFYTHFLGFGVTFENEFYLLMHTPNKQAEISFLLPNHPTQQPLFQPTFGGKGVYLTIEVDDVDTIYQQLKAKGAVIKIDIRDEPWGDRHFAIEDPNGVGIDIVKHTPPQKN